MAYHADDTFLPSWGSGMRPHEPKDPNDDMGFEDYPPKPKNIGMDTGNSDETEILDTQPDNFNQFTPYGTMGEPVLEKPSPVVNVRRLDKVRVAEKSLFLLWWPAFLGACVVATYGLVYWHHWWLANAVLSFVVLIGLAMLAIGLNGGWHGKASMTFMFVNGFCILFMALVGVVLGMYCFHTYTKTYEILQASPVYSSMLPSSHPGASRDAGVVEFAAGSHVDVAHAVGVKNGDMYCVAPILHPESNRYAGFWAVGTNCCSARGPFRCGDVLDKQARHGLVVLDENPFGTDEIPEYLKAAMLAGSQFGIGLPSMPTFVRWTADAETDKDQHYQDAVSFVLYSATALFTFMVLIVMVMSTMASSATANNIGQAYYSVEVYDLGEAEPIRRIKRGRKAKNADLAFDPFLNQHARAADPFMDNL